MAQCPREASAAKTRPIERRRLRCLHRPNKGGRTTNTTCSGRRRSAARQRGRQSCHYKPDRRGLHPGSGPPKRNGQSGETGPALRVSIQDRVTCRRDPRNERATVPWPGAPAAKTEGAFVPCSGQLQSARSQRGGRQSRHGTILQVRGDAAGHELRGKAFLFFVLRRSLLAALVPNAKSDKAEITNRAARSSVQ